MLGRGGSRKFWVGKIDSCTSLRTIAGDGRLISNQEGCHVLEKLNWKDPKRAPNL